MTEAVAQPHHPTFPPKPPTPTGDDKVYQMNGILRKKQLDPTKDFYGFSLERVRDGKPAGEVKFYDLRHLENAESLVASLQTINEGSEVSYLQRNYVPVKIGVKGSLNPPSGFRRTYDPALERLKQESIEKQNARNIAKDILALCFEQYPITADPNNYERAVLLFPQLVQLVKQGEEILMRGE